MTLRVNLTLDEFLARPEVKPYEEYLHGLATPKAVPGFPHSLTQSELSARLWVWGGTGGYVLTEQRCILRTGAGEFVQLPDVAYFPPASFAQPPAGAVDVPPLLAVEILSPDDSYGKVQDKVFIYLASGVKLVWVVDPVAFNVTVYRPGQPPELATRELRDPLLPGLHLSLDDLFARLRAPG